MKKTLLITLFMAAAFIGHAQVEPSAALQVDATDKAVLLPRVASTSAIATPVNGMIVYDISSNCVKAYENNAWSKCLSFSVASQSSGGTAIVNSWTYLSQNDIPLYLGQDASGHQFQATADVAQIGTYNISATFVGVTYSASGEFTATGSQTVNFTATGVPTETGEHFWDFNTTPAFSFGKWVSYPVDQSIACNANITAFPATFTSVDGDSVDVTLSGTHQGVQAVGTAQCGLVIDTDLGVRTSGTQVATYDFSRDVVGLQIALFDNDDSGEGFEIFAFNDGVQVPIAAVIIDGSSCTGDFNNIGGSTASVRRATPPNSTNIGIIVQIRSPYAYDRVTVASRRDNVLTANWNTHAIVPCTVSTNF